MGYHRKYTSTTPEELRAFSAWLGAAGIHVAQPRNEYELLRVEFPAGIRSVYINAKGRESWHNDLHMLWITWGKFNKRKELSNV